MCVTSSNKVASAFAWRLGEREEAGAGMGGAVETGTEILLASDSAWRGARDHELDRNREKRSRKMFAGERIAS